MSPAVADPIHVLAGVIRDARGRILLARRTAGRDLAGAWEFPGGKREPGEGPEQALVRELREELGIAVDATRPLISVPFRYPHKRILLEVREVTGYRGSPQGRERQALAWVAPERLPDYPMPPADRPVVAALTEPDRYLVTPAFDGTDDAFVQRLRQALHAGIRRVQLRRPDLGAAEFAGLARRCAAACREAGVQLLLNRDIALARELQVGVHLGSEQLADLRERPLPSGLPVAASCHDEPQLQRAEVLGAGFAVLGPVAPTPSHPCHAGLGWPRWSRLRESCALPLYAIGGLGPREVAESRRHGAQGIAAIRSLWPG
jgi:8-oxo-dGTP diphosphatase